MLRRRCDDGTRYTGAESAACGSGRGDVHDNNDESSCGYNSVAASPAPPRVALLCHDLVLQLAYLHDTMLLFLFLTLLGSAVLAYLGVVSLSHLGLE